MASTTEIYNEAIEKLQNYVNNQPDKQKRDEATNQITQLRIAIQEAAFDDMTRRTARLQELKDILKGIIDTAGDGSSVSGAIADITSFITTM